MHATPTRAFWLTILLLSAASTRAHAQGVNFQEGIAFANPDGQPLKLNLAQPSTGDGPFPAILCIHGGGFRAGERTSYDALCRELAGRGYVAATVDYRLAPRHPFPAAVYDVKAAVRWLRAHADEFQIDPGRIGVMGGSAGGHLAQFLGVTSGRPQFEGGNEGGNAEQSSRVNCVVSFYGPSDLTRSYGKSVDAAEVLPLFLGGDLEKARARHILASPLSWATPDAAPLLCLHGTKDPYVEIAQSTWIVDRLAAVGVEAELIPIEGAGHGFKGDDARRAHDAMVAFFDRHLKARRPTKP